MTADAGSTMHIAMVAPPWFRMPPAAYGGIEWMCYYLIQGLEARGHDVTLIGVDQSNTRAKRFYRSFQEAPSARLGEPWPEVMHAAYAGRVIKETAPDIVHDHTLAGPLLAFGRPVPTVITAHGPVDGEIGKYYELLSSEVSLIAISDAQRRMAPHLAWIGRVYNAIPIDEYPFPEHKEDYLLWLGRMNPEKAPHLAITAARAVGAPIVLPGKCSEPAERAYFDEEVKPLLGEDVDWIGEANTERKKELLAGARCFVFPIQWQEPFGIVMVEALACGTPVVGLRAGSLPEIVEDGVTGFVRDSPDELPDAIQAVDRIDPRVCRERIAGRFDVDAMVEGYERAYRNALEAA
jgi:glycosyltransferase involved in cell wall biosynthesis